MYFPENYFRNHVLDCLVERPVSEVLFHVNLHVELTCASLEELFLGICFSTERLQIRNLQEDFCNLKFQFKHPYYKYVTRHNDDR